MNAELLANNDTQITGAVLSTLLLAIDEREVTGAA